MKKGFIILMVLVAIIIASCARMGTPDGGPYDEDPPKVLKTTPDFGSLNTSVKKIVLEFDENVKLDKPSEKVIVSPPQIEMPDIEASGKKITVTLHDSIMPGTTYTIDFGDAITDNNEGNPLGDYAFTFSTGDVIDTMQVSGYVLNAEDLEPIKGISVGLYSLGDDENARNFDSETIRTKKIEKISRTDAAGHFVIKGIAPGYYKVFALQDQDGNFMYTQKSEKFAFTDRIIHPSCSPDVRQDTIWHDSIHYDSIRNINYTHFYPDDITLVAFTPAQQSRHLMKYERPRPNVMHMIFSGMSDVLPEIHGLNFNSENAFVVDANKTNDTITYWVRDTQVSRLDTLKFIYSYMANDTNDVLVRQTDTLFMYSKLTNEKLDKQKQQEYDKYVKEWKKKHKKDVQDNPDIDIPPMPETFMDVKTSVLSFVPDQNVEFTFPEPVKEINENMIHLYEKVDTNFVERPFLIKSSKNIRNLNGSENSAEDMRYTLYAEWMPEKQYKLDVDTGAVVSIYGSRMAGFSKPISIKALSALSSLFVSLTGTSSSSPYVIELLNSTGKTVKRMKADGSGKADFYFITPGNYYLRAFCDNNNNGVWDSGDYDKMLQPEQVYYYPSSILLKASFEVSQTWNVNEKKLFEQKPLQIKKQKPEKSKKTMKYKNEERLRNLGRKE